ncbi:MAG: terminase [Gammaproteobacteria bacterium]|nr:terminase [Gammaproteobacteria bacterium]|tara:strand:- start:8247 stop:8606 length:360 start_codon:yes stop_codon:yes gene_type:complete
MEHTTPVATTPDIDNDYVAIRKKLYDLSGQGDEAIELMLEVARESEHPRAFEVLGQLIKQNAEIAEKLMKLQKSKKEIMNLDKIPGLEHQTNNVFVGSTAELQKMLRDEIVIDAENKPT